MRSYCERFQALMSSAVDGAGIRVHAVAGRIKDRESFRAKVIAGADRYRVLDDVTDVAGLRVITYFSEDVERLDRVIRATFDVIEPHSTNKQELLKDREFGYLSRHYVVRTAAGVAEIQVRSILQHAWAEIEHDLGYKAAVAVPREVRREFGRLAALLEGADEAFVALRSRLGDYEDELRRRIETAPDDVPIDVDALTVYVRGSAVVAAIHTAMRSSQPFRAPVDVVARHVGQLAMFGIRTIGDLDKRMRPETEAIVHIGRSLRTDPLAQAVKCWPSRISSICSSPVIAMTPSFSSSCNSRHLS